MELILKHLEEKAPVPFLTKVYNVIKLVLGIAVFAGTENRRGWWSSRDD